MVYDHFNPFFPHTLPPYFPGPNPAYPPGTNTPFTPYTPPAPVVYPTTAEEWMQLIQKFRDSVEAAKLVDKNTNQPDCEDREKKKLEDRVAALEAKIAELTAPRPRSKKKKLQSKRAVRSF